MKLPHLLLVQNTFYTKPLRDGIQLVSDANTLLECFYGSRKGVSWKDSVQKFGIHLLENLTNIQNALLQGLYKAYLFVQFSLSERGKTRWIKSMHIRDRIVQRAVSDYVLLPKVQNKLIYDNGASLKGKGIDFTLDRLQQHLKQHYRYYGDNKGWIVLFDFSKYFDNIPHDKILSLLLENIPKGGRLYNLINYLISLFEIDLSILPQDVADEFSNGIFNNLAYSAYLHKYNPQRKQLREAETLKKSVGVGSQISQIIGIYYPTIIDNFFKIVKSVRSTMMRNHRRIRKFKQKLSQGSMTFSSCCQSAESYMGRLERFDNKSILRSFKKLFYDNVISTQFDKQVQQVIQGEYNYGITV